jgi:hypothetical protein
MPKTQPLERPPPPPGAVRVEGQVLGYDTMSLASVRNRNEKADQPMMSNTDVDQFHQIQ